MLKPSSAAWVHALSGKHAQGYPIATFIDAASVAQLANGHWLYRYGSDHSQQPGAQPGAQTAVIEYYEVSCDTSAQRVIQSEEFDAGGKTRKSTWYRSTLRPIQAGSAGAAVAKLICQGNWSADHPRVLADNFAEAVRRLNASN